MDNKIGVAGVAGGLVGIGTLLYTYIDGERANAREQDLGFSQFAAKISRLEADLEQIDEELTLKDQEISSLRDALSAIGERAPVDLTLLEKRLSDLEEQPVGQGQAASVEAVAAFLVQNHLDELRGPQGPAGPQGPVGPKGEAGAAGSSAALNPRAPIEVTGDFSTDFEPQYFGSTKANLVGCAGKGVRVSCTMLLEPEDAASYHFQARGDKIRLALPTAEWVQAKEFKVGSQKNWVVGGNLSAGIPQRVDIAFDLPSGGHKGFLALEVFEGQSRSTAVWKDIPLTE